MLLALDTSTDWSGLAVYDGSVVLAETTWRSARQHTEQVVGQLELTCGYLGIGPSDLTAIAVALGPGSWAGLRVGMSLAKSLALAGNLPLMGVSTMDVLAWPFRDREQWVVPLIRLGRDRYAAAQYAPLTAQCAEPTEPAGYSVAELPLRRGLYVGDLDPVVRDHVGSVASFPSPADNVRRPAALAEIAWLRWQDGTVDDIVALEPIYLGSPIRQK